MKLLHGMEPNVEDIIKISEVDMWGECGLLKCPSFPLGHKDIGILGSKDFSHGCSTNLQVEFVFKFEVIMCEAYFNELKKDLVRPIRGGVVHKGLFYGQETIMVIDVCVHGIHIKCGQ